MYPRRNLILVSFFIIVAFVLLFPVLNCNLPGKTPSYHRFLKSEDFKKLSRQDQIMKCASCHEPEFESEKKGPHANAYKRLMEHKEFVNSPKYDCDLYKNRVTTAIESCAGCHSSQNLFETILSHYSNMDTLTAHVMAHPLPSVRTDVSSRSTGIDCFTCHSDGNNFISLKQFNDPAHAKELKQSLSTVAKNNMSCYPCHFDVLDTFNAAIAVQRTGAMLCVNCHVETDNQHKSTHYYYWKKDAPDKHNPLIANILTDFRFGWSDDKKSVTIEWENKSMPHTLPIATEIIFNLELLGKDSAVIAKKAIHINRKKQYDRDSYEDLGNKYLGGMVGDDVPLGDAAHYNIAVSGSLKPKMVRISYVDKAQFWISDSMIGRTLLTRVYALPN